MALRSWRRLHGTDIVAQVDPNPLGTWQAKACKAGQPPEPADKSQRQYPLLTAAQAAADYAARTRFKHTCDVSTCGVWLPWPGD